MTLSAGRCGLFFKIKEEELKMNNNTEIFKLFQEQMDIKYDLLAEMIMEEGGRVAAEINMHRRDEHLKYWDPTYYLEGKKKQGERKSNLHKKIEENKKRIAELISAEPLSFPPCADDILPLSRL